MFEDIFGDLLNEEPKCDCDKCENGDSGCAAPVQTDIPAQSHWTAEEDLWSTKSETWNNESHEKLWAV